MARKSKKSKFSRKFLSLNVVGVIVVVSLGLLLWNHYHKPTQEIIATKPSTTSKTTNTSNNSSQPAASNQSSDKQAPSSGGFSGSNGQSPSDGTNQPPLAPTGPFVSNHGSAINPALENSVCNTSPGASCYIEFTMGGRTIKLQAGIADSNGSVYWNGWNVKDYDFTSGAWTITAIASLNGQTKTSTDGTPLTIQ